MNSFIPRCLAFFRYFVCVCLLVVSNIICQIDFSGNGEDSTFSFKIGDILTYEYGDVAAKFTGIYASAGEVSSGNTFAVCKANAASNKFEALAPENVSLNGQVATNPLYGAKINFLTIQNNLPVVAKDGDVRVFVYGTTNAAPILFSSPNLNDASGSQTSGIVGLAAVSSSYSVAPVKAAGGGTFGASGSGVALIKTSLKSPSDQVVALNAATGSEPLNVAAPLDNSSTSIKIGSDVTISSDLIGVHYNQFVGRIYLSFRLTSGSGGARAVVVGRLDSNETLVFEKIVPDSAVSGNDQIVATASGSAPIAITNVTSMKTTTKLDYLIVVGGNGAASSVQNNVYALPIVNYANQDGSPSDAASLQGTLAKYDSTPSSVYKNGIYFNTRGYTQPATTAADLLTDSDVQAIVGGGPVPIEPSNSITSITTVLDSVYVSTDVDYDSDNQPGMFFSQAMFDDEGRIKSWTPWQRVGGTDQKILAFDIDQTNGSLIYAYNDNSIVSKTTWGDGSSTTGGLVDLLNELYPLENGGIQNMFDFSKSTAGFDNFSMMIATGFNQVSLIESGNLQGGVFKYTRGDFASNSILNYSPSIGVVPSGSLVITMKGFDLGPIVASCVASSSTLDSSWIFVGGVSGLSVLCDNSGSGWSGDISNLSDLSGLNLSFKKIGKFKFVKKILADNNFAYVLTNNSLTRISLVSSDFSSNALSAVVLATPESIGIGANGSFEDFVLGAPLIIMTTSAGLLRTGNGANVSTASGPDSLGWTIIPTPESNNVSFKIDAMSNTVNPNQFSSNGQIYSLNSYRGYDFANVNRYSITLDAGAVASTTVQIIPDQFIEGVDSSFINYNMFLDQFIDDGSFKYFAQDKDVSRRDEDGLLKVPELTLLKPGYGSGANRSYLHGFQFKLNLPQDSSRINTPAFIRSASGSLLLAGDFGLKASE